MSAIAERTFIVHPEGSEEIHNLQIVEESELPEFFEMFTVTDSSEPEEFRDDSWQDAARRWRFYDATDKSRDEVEQLVEDQNDGVMKTLHRGDFQSFEELDVF